MSKSLGNFYTIKDALKLHRPEVLRTFILTSQYRNPVVFSEEALDSARKGWERIYGAVRLVREKLRLAPDGDAGSEFLEVLDGRAREKFIEAMDDDFNAPGGLAALHDLTREVNTPVEQRSGGRESRYWKPSTPPTANLAGRCWASCPMKLLPPALPTPSARMG